MNLYDILSTAQNGEAMTSLARQFKLTQDQTEAAVDALLPAFSMGLKHATATPDGMANLFKMMMQPNYQAMFESSKAAFGTQARTAGDDALGALFGSPEMSRAVAEQAAQYAGIGSAIMKKMLPVMAAMIIGGLMRSANQSGMGDIFGQILGQMTGTTPPNGTRRDQPQASPQMPPGGDIFGGMLGTIFGNMLGNPQGPGRTGGTDDLSDITKKFEEAGRTGTELFGHMIETGREVQQAHLDSMQRVFDAFFKNQNGR
jgi:hypothetical protein